MVRGLPFRTLWGYAWKTLRCFTTTQLPLVLLAKGETLVVFAPLASRHLEPADLLTLCSSSDATFSPEKMGLISRFSGYQSVAYFTHRLRLLVAVSKRCRFQFQHRFWLPPLSFPPLRCLHHVIFLSLHQESRLKYRPVLRCRVEF